MTTEFTCGTTENLSNHYFKNPTDETPPPLQSMVLDELNRRPDEFFAVATKGC